MKIIEFNKVDALTGISAAEAPLMHGPKMPLDGVNIKYRQQDRNPSVFYGEVADAVDTDVPGVVRVLSAEDWDAVVEIAREEKQQRLAAHRYQHETGGIELADGTQINTERDAQATITGAYQSLKSGLVPDTDWKSESGWITVTLTELEPIAQAVSKHVRACFKAERVVNTAIANAVGIDDLNAININSEYEAAYTTALV